MEITIFYGKIHYKWPFSIAMLNYQRVFKIILDSFYIFCIHKSLGFTKTDGVLILWPRSRSCLPGSRPRWGHRWPIWVTFIAESDFFAAPLRTFCPSYEFLTTCACHGRVENPLNLQDLRRSLRVSWGLNLSHPNVPGIHTFGPTWVELLDRSAEGSSKLTGAAQRPSPLSNISGMLSWWHFWWNCFLMQEILWLHSPFAYFQELAYLSQELDTLDIGKWWKFPWKNNLKLQGKVTVSRAPACFGIPQDQTEVPKGSEYYLTAMGDYPAKILAYDWPDGTGAFFLMLRV